VSEFAKWIADFFKGVRCWVIVAPWEQAVRVRAGRWTRVLEAGVHPRIPVLDDVRVFNNRLRIASFPALTVTTKDGKTVTAAGLIGFRIVDPLRAMLAMREPETTCSGLAMGHAANYIAARRFDDIAVSDLEASTVAALPGQAPGCAFDFVKFVDFAAVKTFRLLQEQWRPGTSQDESLGR
jgi:regulator of protease activity HflC (stomatin/prohibitin superfamily)